MIDEDEDMSAYGLWVYSDQTQPIVYPSASVSYETPMVDFLVWSLEHTRRPPGTILQ